MSKASRSSSQSQNPKSQVYLTQTGFLVSLPASMCRTSQGQI